MIDLIPHCYQRVREYISGTVCTPIRRRPVLNSAARDLILDTHHLSIGDIGCPKTQSIGKSDVIAPAPNSLPKFCVTLVSTFSCSVSPEFQSSRSVQYNLRFDGIKLHLPREPETPLNCVLNSGRWSDLSVSHLVYFAQRSLIIDATDCDAARISYPTSTRPKTSTSSEGPRIRIASMLTTIPPHSVASLATRLRFAGNMPDEWPHHDACTVLQPPQYGSFNLLYTVEFADGCKRLVRIPSPDKDGLFTPNSSRALCSEAFTMTFLRRNTTIPIPEIFDFDETTENEIGAPYLFMEYVEGLPLYEMCSMK